MTAKDEEKSRADAVPNAVQPNITVPEGREGTIVLFVAQAFYEANSSYDSLLNKIDILQAQMASSTHG